MLALSAIVVLVSPVTEFFFYVLFPAIAYFIAPGMAVVIGVALLVTPFYVWRLCTRSRR